LVNEVAKNKIEGRQVKEMANAISRCRFWGYLQGDFLYRVHPELRKAVTVLISIVLGALILAGLYLIVNGKVLPTITQRIKDMFDYKG
jgi:hypothetical protein